MVFVIITTIALYLLTRLSRFFAQTSEKSTADPAGVLVKLRTALPAPSGTDAATPLKRCLSERVQAGRGRQSSQIEVLQSPSMPRL